MTFAGKAAFIAQVNGSLPVAPKLVPGQQIEIGHLRQARQGFIVQQIALDGRNAPRFYRVSVRGIGKPGHADHAARTRAQ